MYLVSCRQPDHVTGSLHPLSTNSFYILNGAPCMFTQIVVCCESAPIVYYRKDTFPLCVLVAIVEYLVTKMEDHLSMLIKMTILF